MAISVGDPLPDTTLLRMGSEGPEAVQLADVVKGRKVVIFAVPGAFTGTCSTVHVPSFMRTRDQFTEKGIDEIVCLSVNDPFVMQAWQNDTGAGEAGLTMLADPESAFTTAVGMNFDAPPAGLMARSKRYAMYAEDGVVKVLQIDENPGVCDVSGGDSLLAAI